MEATPMSFEALRDLLANLDVPDGEARTLIWVIPDRLGAAITANGAFEIFMAGPELTAALPLVARHLQHDTWVPKAGGLEFAATRLLLGSATHFAALAALIATELARLDLTTDAAMQASFSAVEPIVELAIRRGALSTEVLLGLFAELQVLRVALLHVPSAGRPTTLLGWRGWTQGRDFVLGPHAVEVKATLGDTSRHFFSGVHQLEPQPRPEGGQEMLHLVSLGLTEVEQGGQSLPELVDDLISLLADGSEAGAGARAQLLGMIREYGGTATPGYDHESMSGWSAYQTRYTITFARLYAVDDPEMRLLSSALIDQTFAVPGSVSFELQFPPRVSPFNPAADWRAEIAVMVKS
jgi:hypothetical protein